MAQVWYECKQDFATTQSKMKSFPARMIKKDSWSKWSGSPILVTRTNRHQGKLITLLMHRCIKIF